MRTLYNDMDIHFSLEGVSFHALNIVFEHFERTIPSHIHGNGCYEIHYISTGHGKLKANDTYFELTPNTLLSPVPMWNTPRLRYRMTRWRNTASISSWTAVLT